MSLHRFTRQILSLTCTALLCLMAGQALAIDDQAARRLAKQNNCFRCHAIDRDKDGPAWSSISTKYNSKPDGAEKLMKHLTSAPRIKLLQEGVEQEHKIADYQAAADLKNLVAWILAL